jgi:subtilisin family serine protease
VDEKGNHASFSVTGQEVMLAAPAVNVVTTGLNQGYSVASGTSDSTAIAAGAAALVRARYPNLSATEVIHRLTATATDKGPPGRDDEYGHGIVNLVAALTADVPPLTASPSAAVNTATPSAETEGPRSPSRVWLYVIAGTIVCIIVVTVVVVRYRPRN